MLPRFHRLALPLAGLALGLAPAVASAASVIPDDQIVQGSQCVGLDCVDGESFGFDTMRLKENNLRIGFDDTSVGAFPSNDWQLTANDSASGGANYFSIDDITGATTPFKVMAAARNNALLVSPQGKIGVGTATPVMDVDVNTGDTPGIRLAQAGSGFAPQTWDVAGNEANFFVRDVTNGSRLPFRIRPGAPTSSIDVAANGSVGVGTASPTASLDVARTDGTAKLQVREASTTAAARTLGELQNTGPVALRLTDTDKGTGWDAGTTGASAFSLTPTGGSTALTVEPGGTVSAAGTLQQSADPAAQSDVETVDPDTVLEAVRDLPVERFSYTADGTGAKHLAPAGAAFRSALGLGDSDTALAPGDVAAASLAAVRALAVSGGGSGGGEDSRVPGLVTSVGELKAADGTLGSSIDALKAADGRFGGRIDALEALQGRSAGAVSLLRTADQTIRDSVQRNATAQTASDRLVKTLEKANAAMAKRLKKLEATVKKLAAKRTP